MASGYILSRVVDNVENVICHRERTEARDPFLSSHATETFKPFANELTLIANDFTNTYITVGMARNFAFIRENALTNNQIGATERIRPDEKVPRGNKSTTGVYAVSSLWSKSE